MALSSTSVRRQTDQQRLEQLLAAAHPCLSIVTPEESHTIELINAAVMGTLYPLWYWSAVRGIYPGLMEAAKSLPETENPAAALYYFAKNINDRAVCIMLDLADHLDDKHVRRALRDAIKHFRRVGGTLILLDHKRSLPPVIAAEATPLAISLPDEDELNRIVRATLHRMHRQKPVKVNISRRDLQTIIRNLRGLTRTQAEQIIIDAVSADRIFDAHDINSILAQKRQRLQEDGLLSYIETPVDLGEIGGLRNLKRWLKQRQEALSKEASDFGLPPPRGVLMLGVQGAGKSLCAKAIATAWQRPLLLLDPGALYDRYVGESERRLRQALRQAEMMAPIILWIDEIEKGFASAAAQSSDGGLSQRMFGTLLNWMQEHDEPVFVVATANNIDALPPELLRKGRFDEIFFVDLPGKAVRKQIFSIHLKKRGRDPKTFALSSLAEASEGYSGAEIEQAVISALHKAFADGVKLTSQHVLTAVQESVPLSVTMAERVDQLRQWARTRCTSAG
ncbi:MAG: AAA family ATPase [Phycisphaerales bacterium]|nr:MAG: AAA family ATPase [Phycisphaerales bacterium]